MNSLNYSVFIKELNVLIMSPEWVRYEDLVTDFRTVSHEFGLASIEDQMIIAQNMKFVIGQDGKTISFGSKWHSTNVDMDHVYVWKKHVLTNIVDKNHVLRYMGNDKFVPAF